MNYPSALVEDAVNQISRLPGIGKKTAMRLALHLLKQPAHVTHDLADTLEKLVTLSQNCRTCHSIADSATCRICSSTSRIDDILCVVEDTRDVMAIENTAQYRGLYHVLGGVISPMEGISPADLTIESLVERVKNGSFKEVILALSTTMEGDTTAFYLGKRLKPLGVELTTIARGIPVGGELEYADEVSLGRSILARTPQL